jgi:hypothetical protein
VTRAGLFAAGLLTAAVVMAACATPAPDNAAAGDPMTGEATVEFVQLEGGCWTLDLAGERLLPLVLPEAFRVDGLRVRVSLRSVEAATICMIGRTVEIESIERAE